MGDKMQINRLFQIVYILLDKKSVTSKYLAEKLEVSTRTIYRDIENLCASGVPIYMTKGKGGGIKLLDNFILNKTLLSDEEQNEILSSLQSLSSIKFLDNNTLHSKLATIFNKDNSNWIEVDFSSWGKNDKELFDILKKAILGKKCLSFDYFSTYGAQTTRIVEPLQLWFKDKAWYLRAYCQNKGLRTFKCNRIKNITTLKEEFSRILPEFQTEKTPHMIAVEVTLLLNSSVAYRVYDEFEENQITKNSDGTFKVILNFPEDQWLYGYILSFGANAEVISPIHIRNIIVNEVQKTLNLYKTIS